LSERTESMNELAQERRRSLKRKRGLAKWGMVGVLGVLALTGYVRRNPRIRLLHAATGVALMGLSYWHHTLYVNDPIRKE